MVNPINLDDSVIFFLVFKNINKVNTPEVNQRILVPRGLPPVDSAGVFRTQYSEGRLMRRSVTAYNYH
jgi:hypothetical protein